MDTHALHTSWREVEKVGDQAVLYFYSHLFMAHPEVREMFPVSMADQRGRFFAALGKIVSNVDRIAADATFVEQLGRDHRRFGVVADHFPAAGASLLATLEYFLGATWTDALAADWSEAYGAVARIMVTAAEADEQSAPAWWDAEVVGVERRSIDVAVVQVRPTVPYPFVPGQSLAVEIPDRPRLWRYYSPANAPRADGTLELHVQIVAGGQVSPALARAVRPGDVLRFGAPVGTALCAPAEGGNLLLVAGGTGLAPLRAVVEHLDEQWHRTGAAADVQLFHGARTQWNLYDHHHLTELAGTRPWLRYTPVVSEDPSFRGPRGPVGAIAARAQRWDGYTALVCGSGPMVEHCVSELLAVGMAPTHIRYEQFESEVDPWR
ncbi:globin domain-containing protein [Nocardia mexicana]|uniref:nitric oxide dioxygenase n=1 Tax=Nocardia mexicana TaxID=279262 RepID=A0A370GG11_9NOCA|nr:globin domain-containing protein [Nocardia mexicana]RDI42607.1 NAD(P)H-flavin reductase [Nocardia mexicana]